MDEIQANALGGFVRMTSFGGDNCRGQIQRFKYSWRFDRDVSIISGKRGTQQFSVSLFIEGDENGCMNLNPFFSAGSYGDLLAPSIGGPARFYMKPDPWHVPGARGFSINLTNKTEEGVRITIPFGCPPPGGGGCWLNVNYLYEAVSDDSGRGDSGRSAFCAAYAERAVQRNQENLNRRCGFSGVRWQSNSAHHNTWCLGSTNAAAEAEDRARDAELASCGRGSDILPRVLGGVDLMRHCRDIYGGNAYTRLVDRTVNGWRCVVGPRLESISIEDACRRQYGSPGAIARYRNFNDANSWECVKP